MKDENQNLHPSSFILHPFKEALCSYLSPTCRSGAWLVYLTEWVIRVTMLIVIIPFRRLPAAAKGWLLLIFFLPITGLALFLLIGRVRLPSWRLGRQQELRDRLTKMAERLRGSPNLIHPQLGGHLDQAVKLADNLGHLPILGGNTAELLVNYYAAIDRIIADVEAAENHVHLLFCISPTTPRVSA